MSAMSLAGTNLEITSMEKNMTLSADGEIVAIEALLNIMALVLIQDISGFLVSKYDSFMTSITIGDQS